MLWNNNNMLFCFVQAYDEINVKRAITAKVSLPFTFTIGSTPLGENPTSPNAEWEFLTGCCVAC